MKRLLLLSWAVAGLADGKCLEAGTKVDYPSPHVLQHTWCSKEDGVWIRKSDGCVWKHKKIGGDERVYCKNAEGKWVAEGGEPKAEDEGAECVHKRGEDWCTKSEGVWVRMSDCCVWQEGKGKGQCPARHGPKDWQHHGKHHGKRHGHHRGHHKGKGKGHHHCCKKHEFKGERAEAACGEDKRCVWAKTEKHQRRGVWLEGRCFPQDDPKGEKRHHGRRGCAEFKSEGGWIEDNNDLGGIEDGSCTVEVAKAECCKRKCASFDIETVKGHCWFSTKTKDSPGVTFRPRPPSGGADGSDYYERVSDEIRDVDEARRAQRPWCHKQFNYVPRDHGSSSSSSSGGHHHHHRLAMAVFGGGLLFAFGFLAAVLGVYCCCRRRALKKAEIKPKVIEVLAKPVVVTGELVVSAAKYSKVASKC